METPGDSTLTKWKKLTVESEWGVATSFTSWFHALRNYDIFSVALLSKMPSFLILRKHQANPNWEIVCKISTMWKSRKHRDWGTVTGDHTAMKYDEGFWIGSRTREKTPPLLSQSFGVAADGGVPAVSGQPYRLVCEPDGEGVQAETKGWDHLGHRAE